MNLTDLTRAVAGRANITQQEARTVIDALSDTVIDALANGQDVRLPALGTFTTKQRNERTITGPIGGGKVVPAHSVAVFRPSKGLKDAVK